MPIWVSVTIIIISLLIILFIVLKKFPALAILDAKEMPGEKEEEAKKRIIKQRIERDLARANGFLARIKLALNSFFNLFLDNYYRKLKKIKSEIKKEEKINPLDKKASIEKLLLKVQEDKKQENWQEAEASLIEVVSLDDKNILAFYDLGNVYFEWKKYNESLDTYEHTLKLYKQFKNDPERITEINPQEIRFSLAEVNLKLNNLDEALEYISQALDNEPNNPRFLDLIFDISIMKKDKQSAKDYYDKLVAVNPENQKLKELKEQINKIEDN